MKSSALKGGSSFGDLICEFLLSFGIRRRRGLEGGRRRKLGQEETGERGNGETEVVELGFRQFLCFMSSLQDYDGSCTSFFFDHA